MATIEHEIEIEFNVECVECGADLTADVTPGAYRKPAVIKVTPCTVCLDKARDEGDDAGYARRQEEES